MNKYEIMFIVKATNESEVIKKTAEDLVKSLTDSKAKVLDNKELGQKQLAYPIKKEITGCYYVLHIEADSKAIEAFEHKALIDENVLRHLVIKLDEE